MKCIDIILEDKRSEFSREDISNAVVLTIRAKNLVDRHHEFTEQVVEDVAEKLRPYAFDDNAAQMYLEALQKLYKQETGKEYPLPKDSTNQKSLF